MTQSKTKTYLLLLAIVTLGFFLRVYNIENAPPGIYPDEAVNGIDAARAAETGNFEIFYPDNNGREGLYINIIAAFFQFFGISVLTLKMASILFGTLTIWGVYLLVTELFRNTRIALISAFLVSVSFWAINFSRIGFRAIMVPAILAFSFYFLFKGLRTRKWYDFAAGGFIFGLGLHTYISFRIAPLILIVMLFTLMLTRQKFLRRYGVNVFFVFVLFTLLSAGPMMYDFFISHPEHWESRTANISILNEEVNQGHLFQTFLKTFGLSMAKYNFWGDQNWRHNFPPYALLDPLTGAAFIFGLIYTFIKTLHLLAIRFTKKIREPELEVYVFLLIWFLAMLVPEVMGYEGNPHALRAIGTLPVVFIFSAMTFNYFLGKSEDKSYLQKKIAAGIIIIMLVSIGIFNAVKYHVVWAGKKETAEAFEKNLMDVSAYMKTLPDTQEKYVLAENMQRIPIKLFSKEVSNVEYTYFSQAKNISPKNKNDFIIIMTHRDDGAIRELESKFPQLELEEKNDGNGTKFYILK